VTDLLQGNLETAESAPLWTRSKTLSSSGSLNRDQLRAQPDIFEPTEIHVLAHSREQHCGGGGADCNLTNM
jgi:hypothetical protein